MRVLTPDDVVPLETLPRARLDEMYEAGCRVQTSEQALADAGSNVVAALLNGGDRFYQWEHYPAGDVFCPISHAQYYYHAHPPDVRGNTWGDEHGHFHTFLRPAGFPPEVMSGAEPDCDPENPDLAPPTHLVAISMGFDGRAARLFTTNRWVTGEAWYDAPVVTQLLARFHIVHQVPSAPANVWIGAMLALFRPTVEALLHARDAVVAAHTPADEDTHVFDDRHLEVTSIADIDVRDQIAAIDAARRRSA